MLRLEQEMGEMNLGHPGQPARHLKWVKEQGICSIFPIAIKNNARVYRYDVEITRLDPKGREDFDKVLTGKAADDGQRSWHRRICADIMEALYNGTEHFGTNRQAKYVYDSKKNMFTNMAINLQSEPIVLEAQELSPQCQAFLRQGGRVSVCVTRSQSWILELNDIQRSLVTSTDLQADHTLRTFLELLTSQPFLNARTHHIVGMGQLFEVQSREEQNRRQPLLGGIQTHQGIAKGVRIIDNDGQPKPALVLDVKTCAFYKSNTTFDRVIKESWPNAQNPTDKAWCNIQSLYKGVRAVLTYDPSRSIVIYKFTRESMADITIDREDGGQVSFENFYRSKGIQLHNLHWPAVRAEGSRNNLYPIQCIQVLPNQRIPLEKMSENISRELLNANTTNPEFRFNTIIQQIRPICGNNEHAKFMRDFGVMIETPKPHGEKPNYVPIGVRTAPQIEFANNQFVNPQEGRFNDRDQKYVQPGRNITAVHSYWVVFYSRNVQQQDVQHYTGKILHYAKLKGLQLPQPQFWEDVYQVEGLEAKLSKMREEKKPKPMLILFFDFKANRSHDPLKLLEVRFKVLTQQICVETLASPKTGTTTYTNIANKLNQKLWGLNYVPRIESSAQQYSLGTGNVLAIGYDVSHPGKASAFEMYQLKEKFKKEGREWTELDSLDPSVVGVSANYAENPNNFVGDYFYQQARREAVDPAALRKQMKRILELFVANRRVKPPKWVVVIRDGVSEGQFPMAVSQELPALKQGCRDFNPSYQPKFVFIIVSKRHQKRFFDNFIDNGPGQPAGCTNPVPGSVIDKKMVRADVPEFWMQSHRPLKGTAKLPQYAIPVNEVGMSTDDVQAFINALCHSHQIITSAVSVPEPVYQAHELAKRGSNNYRQFREKFPQFVPKVGDTNLVDHNKLTERLAYQSDEKMVSTRFTA